MQLIVVIGGGAAGLMAAVTAAENGAAVTVLERNEKLGKKLYITGKGRCNCTNLCPADEFRQNVVRNPRFLFSALEALPPEALLARLESWGCPTVVERGNRAFPASQKASDVTRAFERRLQQLGVTVRKNARAAEIVTEAGQVRGVRLENGETIAANAVIVCTGGVSYPSTGSTGDGYRLLAACGHTLLPPKPALIPLNSDADWVKELQGLSLKNVRLTLAQGKKTLFSEIGELLFTHFGLSGPLVLSASAYVTALEVEELEFRLDLKPGLDRKQLDRRVVRDIAQAIEVSDAYAPEHLILAVREPRDWLDRVQNAGSIFLGDWTPEALGDYCSGSNHVLPTGGAARAWSGLSVASFQKAITVQEATRAGIASVGRCAAILAHAEGLQAHARAVELRLEQAA